MPVQTVDVTQATQQTKSRLTDEEVDQFHREGFVIVRGLVEAPLREQMLAAAREGLQRQIPPIEYEADLHYPGAPSNRDLEGGGTVRRLKQAHARHFAFTEWIMQPGLTERMRQLLGPQIVVPLAHHNCIMTKHPRYSSETGWHQDVRYWSFARPELVSVWLALGEESERNGCLRLIPGSHRMAFEQDRAVAWSPDHATVRTEGLHDSKGDLRSANVRGQETRAQPRERFDEALFLRPELPENRELIDTSISAELQPGDVLFFHCRTLHAAGRNQTDRTKYSVVYTFRPADNPPTPGTRSASLPEWLIPPRKTMRG